MRRLAQTLAGLAISGAALWLTLRGKDLAAIWQAARDADYRYLVPYLLVLVAIHFARTVRWGILLASAGLRTPLPTVLELGWSGQFAATLLPGGVATGDVVKAYQLARLHRGRAGRALVTVFFDRALALTVLSAVALAGALAASGETRLAASRVVVALLFAGGLLFLALQTIFCNLHC